MSAQELVFTGPGSVSIRSTEIEDPGTDELVVETRCSAISPGTELLVYNGAVPTDLPADLTLESINGDLDFPTTYGYAAVGDVVDTGAAVGDEWLGRRVFAFHPHQSRFRMPEDSVVTLPDSLSDEKAALLPTVETATNFMLDGAPTIGERVVVFGAGSVGLCTTRLLAAYPLDELVVVEPIEMRRERARSFGADRVCHPDERDRIPTDADLVYELSGQPAVLDSAIETVGYDGRVVVGSWYGSKTADLDLGGSFHRDRISVESSQVSTLSPDLRGRWTTERRCRTALDQLDRIDEQTLITDRIPFTEAQSAYDQLHRHPDTSIQVILTYDD